MSPTTSARRRQTRGLAAFLLLVAAAAHIPLIEGHLHEAPYIGWGFILLSTVCILLAVSIVLADHVAVWTLAAASCLAALVAYLASRTIGLPEIGDDVGNWTEPLSFPAIFAEVSLLVLAVIRMQTTVTAQHARMSSEGYSAR
jgi:hypothetical protein